MFHETETIFCKNCGVEITGVPVIENGWAYCCLDCFHHLQCECAALFDLEEDRSSEQGSLVGLLAAYAD